jgi:hypothetical protein
MATIYIYNQNENRIEQYFRGEDEPMPYNKNNSLTVNEFRGSSNSSVLWSDVNTMEAFNQMREIWGKPIYVGFAFKRIWEGGHGYQSQHYAGTSFDVGQNLSGVERNNLRNAAINSGLWSYVEPAYLTPTWVHFDKRQGPPACPAGYPLLRRGAINNYVFVLQDALNAIGYTGSGLDGIFGINTENAVKAFQSSQGLSPDGIVGCETWTMLTRLARGIGKTATVVNP